MSRWSKLAAGAGDLTRGFAQGIDGPGIARIITEKRRRDEEEERREVDFQRRTAGEIAAMQLGTTAPLTDVERAQHLKTRGPEYLDVLERTKGEAVSARILNADEDAGLFTSEISDAINRQSHLGDLSLYKTADKSIAKLDATTARINKIRIDNGLEPVDYYADLGGKEKVVQDLSNARTNWLTAKTGGEAANLFLQSDDLKTQIKGVHYMVINGRLTEKAGVELGAGFRAVDRQGRFDGKTGDLPALFAIAREEGADPQLLTDAMSQDALEKSGDVEKAFWTAYSNGSYTIAYDIAESDPELFAFQPLIIREDQNRIDNAVYRFGQEFLNEKEKFIIDWERQKTFDLRAGTGGLYEGGTAKEQIEAAAASKSIRPTEAEIVAGALRRLSITNPVGYQRYALRQQGGLGPTVPLTSVVMQAWESKVETLPEDQLAGEASYFQNVLAKSKIFSLSEKQEIASYLTTVTGVDVGEVIPGGAFATPSEAITSPVKEAWKRDAIPYYVGEVRKARVAGGEPAMEAKLIAIRAVMLEEAQLGLEAAIGLNDIDSIMAQVIQRVSLPVVPEVEGIVEGEAGVNAFPDPAVDGRSDFDQAVARYKGPADKGLRDIFGGALSKTASNLFGGQAGAGVDKLLGRYPFGPTRTERDSTAAVEARRDSANAATRQAATDARIRARSKAAGGYGALMDRASGGKR